MDVMMDERTEEERRSDEAFDLRETLKEERDSVWMQVEKYLDELGLPPAAPLAPRLIRIRALIADRDRLAKRVQELEADIAGADEFLRSTAWENPAGATTVEARVRLAYEAGVTDGAHNEAMVVRSLESRLAATDARLTALVDLAMGVAEDRIGEEDARARLAALRAPGVEAPTPDDRCRRATQRLVEIAGADGPMSLEDAIEWAGGKVEALESALATARRERDEAVESAALIADRVARENSALARQMGDRDLLAAEERHRAIATAMTEVAAQIRARALVAGQAPDPFRAQVERDAIVDGLRAQLAEAQGEVKRLTERAEKATETFNSQLRRAQDAVSTDRDALRARLDEAGRLIERFMGPWANASHHEHLDEIEHDAEAWLADLRAWGKQA